MNEGNFQRALKFVLEEEGGYTNDPHDHGGSTNFGLLQGEYNEWRREFGHPERDIRLIEPGEVEQIYLQKYWLPAHCDEMPWPVCVAHFDAAVNCGLHQAALFLQRVVLTAADGKIGSKTLSALHAEIDARGSVAVAEALANQRPAFYRMLADNDATQHDFLAGWLNRVDALLALTTDPTRSV